jgi:hypothetical protein
MSAADSFLPFEGKDPGTDIYEAINSILCAHPGRDMGYASNADVHDRRIDLDELWKSSDGWRRPPLLLVGVSAANSNKTGACTDPGQGNARVELLGPASGLLGIGLMGLGTLSRKRFKQ